MICCIEKDVSDYVKKQGKWFGNRKGGGLQGEEQDADGSEVKEKRNRGQNAPTLEDSPRRLGPAGAKVVRVTT